MGFSLYRAKIADWKALDEILSLIDSSRGKKDSVEIPVSLPEELAYLPIHGIRKGKRNRKRFQRKLQEKYLALRSAFGTCPRMSDSLTDRSTCFIKGALYNIRILHKMLRSAQYPC